MKVDLQKVLLLGGISHFLFYVGLLSTNIQAGGSIPKDMIGHWKALNSDCEDDFHGCGFVVEQR